MSDSNRGENGSGFVTRDEFYVAIKDLAQGLEKRLDKMSSQIQGVEGNSKPNFATMASWASVIITVFALLGGSASYYFNVRIALLDQARKDTSEQINTRIERLENIDDESRMDEIRRYRELLHDKLKEKE